MALPLPPLPLSHLCSHCPHTGHLNRTWPSRGKEWGGTLCVLPPGQSDHQHRGSCLPPAAVPVPGPACCRGSGVMDQRRGPAPSGGAWVCGGGIFSTGGIRICPTSSHNLSKEGSSSHLSCGGRGFRERKVCTMALTDHVHTLSNSPMRL